MGLLDKITGKKPSSDKSSADKGEDKKPKASASAKPKKAQKNDENVLDMVKEPASAEATADKPVLLKEDTGRAHEVLHNYHLSEKSNLLSTTGRYVFRVSKKTNKLEVKKAIERVYDVHVADVNIMNIKGKTRRSGKITGKTSNWKKAYVTLKSGEKISGLAEGI
jgi:large subunit ribosomal protein L23